ncbi:MAG: hypothetical protein AB1744_05975 [Candidatus Zixiibacteriota bacterium]
MKLLVISVVSLFILLVFVAPASGQSEFLGRDTTGVALLFGYGDNEYTSLMSTSLVAGVRGAANIGASYVVNNPGQESSLKSLAFFAEILPTRLVRSDGHLLPALIGRLDIYSTPSVLILTFGWSTAYRVDAAPNLRLLPSFAVLRSVIVSGWGEATDVAFSVGIPIMVRVPSGSGVIVVPTLTSDEETTTYGISLGLLFATGKKRQFDDY